ncbi:MAG: cobalamin-dependent protein, partial [Chloroflexi bacterium]|nr:cobalamin-dependent protein [Chloroflexota bacterium]
PLGLLYVAAAARAAGYTAAVYDGTFDSGPDDFARALADFRPDVVLFMSLITLRPTTRILRRFLRLSSRRSPFVLSSAMMSVHPSVSGPHRM